MSRGVRLHPDNPRLVSRCPRRRITPLFTTSTDPILSPPPSVPLLPKPGSDGRADQEQPSRLVVGQAAPPPIPPLELWSLAIDPLTMGQAVERVRFWVDRGEPCCRFVVTPNVDHVVQLHRRPELLADYRQASLTLTDGWPLVSVSRLYGRTIPERVAGADLLPALCDDATNEGRPLRLFLLGGKPGVPERAAAAIHARWPGVSVCGTSSPPLGFERDGDFNRRLCRQISSARPDILVVGLGFPKQETWLAAHRAELRAPVALAIGGTIDFLAGEQTRAPRWIRSAHLEWLHRLATNPRRLAGRYLTDALWFPGIAWANRPAQARTVNKGS